MLPFNMLANALTLSFNPKAETYNALTDTEILTSRTLCIIYLQYELVNSMFSFKKKKASNCVQCLHGIFCGKHIQFAPNTNFYIMHA
jgi:hypothetical protein